MSNVPTSCQSPLCEEKLCSTSDYLMNILNSDPYSLPTIVYRAKDTLPIHKPNLPQILPQTQLTHYRYSLRHNLPTTDTPTNTTYPLQILPHTQLLYDRYSHRHNLFNTHTNRQLTQYRYSYRHNLSTTYTPIDTT